MNALAPTLALAATCLISIIVFELSPQPTAKIAAALPSRQLPAAASPTSTPSNDADTALRVETLLTRPLFSQTRRIPAIGASASVSPSIADPLPRLTGIMIDGPRRLAIFAAPTERPGSKPTTLTEGGLIGPFTIKAIGPRQVIVTGPDGERTLHTGFDPVLQPPPPPAPTLVSYNFDAPKLLNIPPGPSLLSRSLQPAASNTISSPPQPIRPTR